VARDRKRAKQRRDRRAARAPARGASGESPLAGTHGPGELGHASADVDEFDAALLRGAGGTGSPLPDAPDAPAVALDEDPLVEPAPAPGSGGEPAPAEDLLDAGGGGADGGGIDDDGDGPGGPGGGGGESARERPSGAPLPSGNRAVAFIRASWAELQRVQWPDRRQVSQATAVVLGFVAIAGLYLGAADFVAKEIVEFVL
jgi:preprotein translocase subunit SecE